MPVDHAFSHEWLKSQSSEARSEDLPEVSDGQTSFEFLQEPRKN
jgi:hypothetical protein